MIRKHSMFRKTLLIAGMSLALSGCLTDANGPDALQIVPVNNVPVVESTPTLTAQTNVLYSYTVTASDADPDDSLTLSASELPSWLSFDAATGVLSGTPLTADVGEHAVTITVSDGSDEVSQTFTITVSVATSGGTWSLVWSDEFDGSSLNTDNWNIQTGDGSEYGLTAWGNAEQEWYKAENITVADGNLVITAKEEPTNGYPYTSGRMRSDNKVDIKL